MMRPPVLVFALFHLASLAGVFEVRFKESPERSWLATLVGHASGVTVNQRPYISNDDLIGLDAHVIKVLADCILLHMPEVSAAILRNSRPNFHVRLLY